MFPTDIIQALRLTIQILRKLKWIFLLILYGAVFTSGDVRYMLLILSPLVLSTLAYIKDKQREEHGMDDFRGDRLFFRYGELIYRTVISVPVNDAWSFAATRISAMTLRMTLAQHIASRLPSDAVQVIDKKVIIDLQSREQKEFTRVFVRSPFGSSITFFIHYAAFGHTITAQYFTYRRGAQSDWEAAKFIFASPLSIWFWGVPWLLNRYSILANISRYRESSFDGIDLETMYQVTHRVVLEETEKTLKLAGLLTEEIARSIQYHITNVQNVAVTNSSGVSIGDIGQQAAVDIQQPATA